MGVWWVMAWVRQYSAPNVVGARKLKAFIFYTINLGVYACVMQHLNVVTYC